MCSNGSKRLNATLDRIDTRMKQGDLTKAQVLLVAAEAAVNPAIEDVKSSTGVPFGLRIRSLRAKIKGRPTNGPSAVEPYD